jgi:hypothetical protein
MHKTAYDIMEIIGLLRYGDAVSLGLRRGPPV